MYLCNAFSLQMVKDELKRKGKVTLTLETVDALPKDLESAVGHADTAAVLGVPMNRVDVKLNSGDSMYVAQLDHGRLPEGTTTLPEGYSFMNILVRVDD